MFWIPCGGCCGNRPGVNLASKECRLLEKPILLPVGEFPLLAKNGCSGHHSETAAYTKELTFKFELPLSRVFVSCTPGCGLSGWRCRWSGGDPKLPAIIVSTECAMIVVGTVKTRGASAERDRLQTVCLLSWSGSSWQLEEDPSWA